MNNYKYHLRVRAYNGFQPSEPSQNVTLHPVGEVPQNVLNLTAECFDQRDPHRCESGFTADTRISIVWRAPFFDDRVTDVIGYRIEFSSDNGASWTQHSVQSEKDPLTRGYALTCLLNDQPYLVRVGAINMYGLGAWTQIGPLTPRWCPHLQFCNKCLEPFFEVCPRLCLVSASRSRCSCCSALARAWQEALHPSRHGITLIVRERAGRCGGVARRRPACRRRRAESSIPA